MRYTKQYRLDRERSEAKQLVIGWEEKDGSLDWRIMAQSKSKCSQRKGMRKLEEQGGTMANRVRAVKQTKRTMPKLWLVLCRGEAHWRKGNYTTESEVLGGLFMWASVSSVHCKSPYREEDWEGNASNRNWQFHGEREQLMREPPGRSFASG